MTNELIEAADEQIEEARAQTATGEIKMDEADELKIKVTKPLGQKRV